MSAIGLGGLPMSIEGRPDADQSIAAIHAALDAGITLIDTADACHLGSDEVRHNEKLIAGALAGYGADTSHVLVTTKGGHLRTGTGPGPPTGHQSTSSGRARRPCVAWAWPPTRPEPALSRSPWRGCWPCLPG